MPTRLIREGIIDSDAVNALGWAAEVFYRRLLNKVDDFGLYDARLSVLRATLYPLLLTKVSEKHIAGWLDECAEAGLLVVYESGGKEFLQVLNTQWKTRSQPKYPLPDNTCKQLQTDVNSCSPIRSRIRSRIEYSDASNGDDNGTGAQPETKRGAKRFVPTPAEVAAYAATIDYQALDASAFVDYYEARGWKFGNGKPVHSWQACVRTWKRREGINPDGSQKPQPRQLRRAE